MSLFTLPCHPYPTQFRFPKSLHVCLLYFIYPFYVPIRGITLAIFWGNVEIHAYLVLLILNDFVLYNMNMLDELHIKNTFLGKANWSLELLIFFLLWNYSFFLTWTYLAAYHTLFLFTNLLSILCHCF